MFSEIRRPVVAGEIEPVVSLRGIVKNFRMHRKPSDHLFQSLFGKRGSGRREFQALRGIDLDVERGETLGIIGRNGSGKSTLLQIIAGTLQPTEGVVSVRGRVAALLELGSGFNPEFTGRENISLNATILGLSRAQVQERLQDIIAFADIGEFIDQPVRSYSSGMAMRLAFAVVAHVDADVLIVDEALSVGDALFAQKCMRFLRDFQKSGTLLFVSHDAGAVTNLCSRAIWLDAGSVREVGDAKTVVESYMAHQHAADRGALDGEVVRVVPRAEKVDQDIDVRHAQLDALRPRMAVFEFDPSKAGQEFGSGQVAITDVRMVDEDGRHAPILEGGELVRLEFDFVAKCPIARLIAGFYVKDRLGQNLFGDNTYLSYRDNPVPGTTGDLFTARFEFRMPTLPSGTYLVDVAVASGTQDDHVQHQWVRDVLQFRTVDETMRHGLVGIPMRSISLVRRLDC